MAMTEQEAAEFYGATPAEWLERWDAGRSVWSIEMGGLGPGYEQAIQVMAVELLRWLVANGEPLPDDKAEWPAFREKWEAGTTAVVDQIGPSGAQHGAAQNIAAVLYRHGPAKGIQMAPDDRRIQVSRNFPGFAAPLEGRSNEG